MHAKMDIADEFNDRAKRHYRAALELFLTEGTLPGNHGLDAITRKVEKAALAMKELGEAYDDQVRRWEGAGR